MKTIEFGTTTIRLKEDINKNKLASFIDDLIDGKIDIAKLQKDPMLYLEDMLLSLGANYYYNYYSIVFHHRLMNI